MINEELVLKIQNFDLTFDTVEGPLFVLRDINLDVSQNQIVAIIGESGSGKTSLANAVLQLFSQEEITYFGNIFFYPKKDCCENEIPIVFTEEQEYDSGTEYNVTTISSKVISHLRGNHISMIFQDPFSALNPVIPVGKQVEEVVLNHSQKKLDKSVLKEKVLELFNLVKLPEPEIIYKKFPHQLSGGQIQRVCIAIGIANNPELIIADEPTTALDASLRKDILDLLTQLAKKENSALILITHDINLIKNYVDYIYILYAGEIVEYGSGKTIAYNPAHPYTEKLISCQPKKDKKGKPLTTIPGQLPDLRDEKIFDRCIFYDRCDKKISLCEKEKPEFYSYKGQKVKCFLYEK